MKRNKIIIFSGLYIYLIILFFFGFIYFRDKYSYRVLSKALESPNLTDDEIEKVRRICGEKSSYYIKYYLTIEKKRYFGRPYHIRNLFTACPLKVIKDHEDIFFNEKENWFDVFYGLARQNNLPEYFEKEELVKYMEESKEKRLKALIELMLYRYYGENKYETKIRSLIDEFKYKDGGEYYSIQYFLMKFSYEKGMYNIQEIQKMVSDGFYCSSDTRKYFRRLGVKNVPGVP